MILSYCTSFTRKVPKLRFLFVLQSVNSFAMSMVESLSVFSFCMFKTVRLLNRSWFILERSHVFSLRAVEKDIPPVALEVVAGFTRISLHLTIILRNRAEYRLILSRRGRRPSGLKSDDIPQD